MKYLSKIAFGVLCMLALACCNGTANQKPAEKAPESTEATTKPADPKAGKEYTSAYVCPMHCEGSGSDKAGKCPNCGMDYVANPDHKMEEHNH
jgi:predicted nucleic acid binding AN1-type Zn finger protein